MIPKATPAEIENRLDLHLVRTFGEAENLRQKYDFVVKKWRQDDTLARLALSRLPGFGSVSPAEDEAAVRNLAAYHLEPYYVSTMNVGQARDYFLAIQRFIQFSETEVAAISGNNILVETLHHHCIFSLLYILVAELIKRNGYRKVLLLHQRLPLDPRLIATKTCVETLLGIEAQSIHLDGEWLSILRKEAVDETIVLYMGDMPPALFAQKPEGQREKSTARLHFFAEPDITITLEAITVGRSLARLTKAEHVLLDFPEPARARLPPAADHQSCSAPSLPGSSGRRSAPTTARSLR